MLEAKNLVKIYKPKRGVPVKALDNVSIRFPEKGMVFLLGKSGSGKSTLLNVLGGLDRLNSGEILIKGKSSKSFRQKHFDSYRNTYVGFIFQEYNILDEFSVGANVALAIQLQGRKATNEAINSILKEVDLDGYGNRKPNELSGGQKQRVAIARALVKSPEIIMADEPTGALDSVTGRQVLDTLKKLSKEKLVIVVSHDREFAEKYADRIIELADGRVISDMEYSENIAEEKIEGIVYNGNTLTLPEAYELTEEDRLRINEYIRDLNDGKVTLEVATHQGGSGRKSVKTDESKIVLQNSSGFKLIKSRLPMKYAFKIGSSGLKYKKFRLVVTILLSCIAFGLFGLSDTFGSFDYVTTCSQSIIDSNIGYASFSKGIKKSYIGSDEYYFSTYGTRFTKEDIAALNKDTPVNVRGVYNPSSNDRLDLNSYLGSPNFAVSEDAIYSTGVNGYIEVDSDFISDIGAELIYGNLPSKDKDEIAISLYLAQSFVKFGYVDFDAFEKGEMLDKNEAQAISSPKQLIGKTLFNKTIVGIVDTKVDLERYKPAYTNEPDTDAADMILKYALMSEFEKLRDYSLACLIMVGDGCLEDMMLSNFPVYPSLSGISVQSPEQNYFNHFSYVGNIANVDEDSVEYIGSVEDKTKGIALPRQTAIDMARVMWDMGEFGNRDDKDYQYPSDEELLSLLASTDITLCTDEVTKDNGNWLSYSYVEIPDMRVIAVFGESIGNGLILCDESYLKRWCEISEGDFVMALGSMPKNRNDIIDLVAYCDSEHGDMRYEMNNTVAFELSALRETMERLSPIFLYIGLGFALFASLMLSNFITMSISNKKREIGILRAIGSRGNDVFRIFFSESFIIAMINFVLTSIGLIAIVTVINTALRQNTGLLITALTIGPRQIILEFAVSLLVAVIASYIPVKRIASKKPIDAIRDR